MSHKRRDPKKEASWRRQIRRQARSGMTVRAWCLDQQVNEATFHWRRRELARGDGELEKPTRTQRRTRSTVTSSSHPPLSPAFVPVRVAEDDRDDGRNRGDRDAYEGRIEIVLPDGRCVRVTGSVDRQALTDVLEVLTLTPSSEATIHAGSQSQRGARSC